MKFTQDQLLQLDATFRKNLINSIHGAKSVSLIGSIDSDNRSNLAIFSQVFHVGANPPLVGILFRPESGDSHTLTNIRNQKRFTIQHIREPYMKQAHQTAARYPKGTSEFDAAELEFEFLPDFEAPFVKQAHVRYAAELREIIPIEINKTTLVIAEIVLVDVAEHLLSKDGFIKHDEAGTIAGGGLDAYYSIHKLARLSYPKPDKDITFLEE